MKNGIIILVLAFTIPFIGCRSNEKDKLVGDWREIPYVNPDEAKFLNVWTFYAGDGLIITRTFQDGEKDSISYTYNIDGDKLRLFDGSEFYNGEYWVDVLDKEYLKMTRKKDSQGKDTWMRVEFAKK